MRRLLPVILLLLSALTLSAQTRQDEDLLVRLQAAQIRLLMLQQENDSLRRALTYKKATENNNGMTSLEHEGVVDTWDLLKGGDGVIDAESITPDPRHMAGNRHKGVYELRLEQLGGDFLIPYDERLGAYIDSYTVKRRKRTLSVLARYERWEDFFRTTFQEVGIPEDLTLLAVVESAINPNAESFAGAAGMWQLMPDTAQEWGLKVGLKGDERYDVVKSTKVAARILKSLYNFFGDWPLAVCAYNCGPGNVSNAIRKAGNRRGFWDIYDYLPAETRAYLPSLIAVYYLFNYQ